jgi:hypothetical protein
MDNNELHERGVDDQFSFNVLMTSDFAPDAGKALQNGTEKLIPTRHPLRRVEGDPKVFYAAPGSQLKLMVLPSALFAGVLPSPLLFRFCRSTCRH